MEESVSHAMPAAPSGVALFATRSCPYCVRAEQFLRAKGASRIDKIMVDEEPEERLRMLALSGGRRTVPQIFIAGVHIGGCDDLLAFGRDDPDGLQGLIERAFASMPRA